MWDEIVKWLRIWPGLAMRKLQSKKSILGSESKDTLPQVPSNTIDSSSSSTCPEGSI